MNLKGSFEPSSLASILQLLSAEERTGALKLTNGESEVKIFIKYGDVICAMGSQRETRLGTLLTRDGLISAKDLAYCLSVSTEKKQALGSVLVEKGFVTPEVLQKTIHRQAEEVIFNLFVWESGQFEYHDSDDIPRGALDTKIDIMNIIMEAMRRIDEMVYFMSLIPNDQMVFAVSENLENLEDLHFNERERRFMSFVDGRRTVRELIRASGYDEFTAYQILDKLIKTKVIEHTDKTLRDETAQMGSYSDIILVYNEVLQVIRNHLEAELERWLVTMFNEGDDSTDKRDIIRKMHKVARHKWTYQIIESCKPQLSRVKRDIFEGFHPANPVDANILAVTQSLSAVRDSSKGRFVLVKCFSLFVGNLIKTVVNSFSERASRNMLKDLNQMLVAINESETDFPEKEEIVKDLMDILVQVAQYYKREKRPAVTSGKIFDLGE
jgi:hypothetical protein